MTADTSSARRKTPKVYGRNDAVIRAILYVGAISTLFSATMQVLIATFIVDRSFSDYFVRFLVVGASQAALRSVIPSICFVLIFWFAKDFFIERWVLYGTAWWCYSMLGVACMAVTGSSGLAESALPTVTSLIGFLLSAYLTKVIFSRVAE